MPHIAVRNKRRGYSFEREIVNLFKKLGFNAKRAYASNGESLGLKADVDVLVNEITKNNNLAIQCKRKKKLPGYLDLEGSSNATIFRQDRGKPYIMMNLETFFDILK